MIFLSANFSKLRTIHEVFIFFSLKYHQLGFCFESRIEQTSEEEKVDGDRRYQRKLLIIWSEGFFLSKTQNLARLCISGGEK
jgi:hypothetical protein